MNIWNKRMLEIPNGSGNCRETKIMLQVNDYSSELANCATSWEGWSCKIKDHPFPILVFYTIPVTPIGSTWNCIGPPARYIAALGHSTMNPTISDNEPIQLVRTCQFRLKLIKLFLKIPSIDSKWPRYFNILLFQFSSILYLIDSEVFCVYFLFFPFLSLYWHFLRTD